MLTAYWFVLTGVKGKGNDSSTGEATLEALCSLLGTTIQERCRQIEKNPVDRNKND